MKRIGYASLAVVYVATAMGLGFALHSRDREVKQLTRERAELQFQLSERDARVQYMATVRTMPKEKTVRSMAKLIQRLKPKINADLLSQIDTAIQKYSNQYDLPPELVVFVMRRESYFKPYAKSRVGAIGLMQIFPKWHTDKMHKLGINYQQVYNIDHNVHLGCWILRGYIDEMGSLDKALTRYVGGHHPKYVQDILSRLAKETVNE